MKFPNPVLRHVMRAHPAQDDQSNRAVIATVESLCSGDEFSLSQWRVGISYYRERFRAAGLSGDLLIDLGCGSGNWALAGAAFFNHVVGFDIHRKRIACARKLTATLGAGNVSFVAGDVRRLALRDLGADCVLAYNLLPYVDRWEQVIQDAYRVLKPGGRLWLGWADFGAAALYGVEGLVLLRRHRFRECGIMLLDKLWPPFARSRAGARMWLPVEAVECQLDPRFGILWRSWERPAAFSPLLSERFLGVPFFREILCERL